jgi:hypothetical protein
MANIGAVTKAIPPTTLSNAIVVITLGAGKGDALTASCSAEFELDTGATSNGKAVEGLVAFPVTGLDGGAVRVTRFAATVDGSQPPTVLRRFVEFPPWVKDESVHGVLAPAFAPVTGPRGDPELNVLVDGSRYFDAFLWTQSFRPRTRARVTVAYALELHPQSMAYSRRYMHMQNPDLVPFDAAVAGESTEMAYFFDYILRSGSTWSGPIGHETITLKTDDSVALDFDSGPQVFGQRQPLPEDVYALERRYNSNGAPDFSEALEYQKAGINIDARNFKAGTDCLIWEVDHGKPKSDILVEIPLRAVKRLKAL